MSLPNWLNAPQAAAAHIPLRRLKLWVKLSRPQFHLVGILPYVLGYLLAVFYGHAVNSTVMLLGASGVVLIMLIAYYLGEYFDYETDSINRGFNVFSGGSRVLQTGEIKRSSPLIAALLLLFPVAAVGLVLHFYYRCGAYTIPLGIIGLSAGVFYSAKPVQWAYHSLGELLIGVCYGWLTVNTGYYLQTGQFHLIGTFVALPISTSIMAVILINEFPDREADKTVGKRNLVVLLGTRLSSTLYQCLVLLTLSFAFLPAVVAFSFPYQFLPLILVPVVLKNLLTSRELPSGASNQLESLCAGTLLLSLLVVLLPLVSLTYELARQVLWLQML